MRKVSSVIEEIESLKKQGEKMSKLSNMLFEDKEFASELLKKCGVSQKDIRDLSSTLLTRQYALQGLLYDCEVEI